MLLRASDMAVLLPFFRINTSLCPFFSRYYPGVLWILMLESSPHFSVVVGKQLQTIEIKETMLCLRPSAILKTFLSCFDQSVDVFVFI